MMKDLVNKTKEIIFCGHGYTCEVNHILLIK